jgi:hypothetical protein
VKFVRHLMEFGFKTGYAMKEEANSSCEPWLYPAIWISSVAQAR